MTSLSLSSAHRPFPKCDLSHCRTLSETSDGAEWRKSSCLGRFRTQTITSLRSQRGRVSHTRHNSIKKDVHGLFSKRFALSIQHLGVEHESHETETASQPRSDSVSVLKLLERLFIVPRRRQISRMSETQRQRPLLHPLASRYLCIYIVAFVSH